MRIPAFLIALVFAAAAQAAPAPVGDDLDSLLAEKGLLARIDQVRQSVGVHASELVFTAMGFLGAPYRRGGSTAETGFDCSGLIGYVYQTRGGVVPPRTVSKLQGWGQPISNGNVRSGDLVLFGKADAVTHAGIYVGEGRFVHAPSTGGVVRLDYLSSKYWAAQQVTFRRP